MGTDRKGCRVLMSDAGFALQLLLAFGGGIISFLSPCVLPLLPGYLGLMSGYSVADLQAGRASGGHMLRVTSLFVAGFTVVFVATGAAATQVGRFLVQYQSVTERVAGALILAFGVLLIGMSFTGRGLFGVFARERRLDVRPSRLGRWAPPVMGMAFGFGWTPCIGAILGAILTAAGTRETVAQGMLLLLVYSLGLGIPFILAGLGMTRAMGAVRALRRWLRPLSISSGALLAAFGVVMLTGNIGRLAGFFVEVMSRVPLLESLTAI